MSIDKPDEDEDVRELLGADSRRTSARHDESVRSVARALANERGSRARRRLPAWVAMAAGVAVIGVALWIGGQWQERRQEASAPALVTSVVLSAGMIRGDDEIVRIDLPATPATVQLQLDLATVAERALYRAELRGPSGRSVWSAEALEPQTTQWGKAVFVELESALLQQGQYELLLQGPAGTASADDSAYYYFDVQRRN